MKILQVIFSLSSGGAERFVVDLSNQLARNPNNEVAILMVHDKDEPRYAHYLPDVAKNVRVISLGQNKGYSLKSIWKTYSIIRAERPDIVHCHSNLLLIYLPLLLYRKPKYIHTLHSLADKCLQFMQLKSFQRWLYNKHVLPITISKECSCSYHSLYGNSNDTMIINGRARIQPTDKLKLVKEEIQTLTNKESSIFINVARCQPEKNHKMLFEVFERLNAEGYDYHLLVLGSNHEENAEKYAQFPNIHILGERRNVADYLSCADFFILSSLYEGLPLSMLEAMSMGCIPVTTPAGGIVDVIRDEDNGFLAQGFSADDLYNTIIRAVSKKNKVSKQKIMQEYDEHYTMETCMKAYYTKYNEIQQK